MLYFLVILAGLLFSVRIAFSKLYSLKNGDSFSSTIIFTSFVSIISFLIVFALNGFKIEFNWFSFIFAMIIAFCETLTAIIAIKVLKLGSSFVYSLFLLFGGMVGPFIYGIIFLKEVPTVCCIIGTILSILTLFLPLASKRKEKSNNYLVFILLCIAAFLVNGACGIVMKMHQVSGREVISSEAFTATYFLIMGVTNLIIFGFSKIKKSSGAKEKVFNKWFFIFGACYALAGAFASFLNILCAKNVPVTIQPSLVMVSCTLGSALFGITLFKNKVKLITVMQMLLAIGAGILLIF